jgi:hypothetical protein
MNDDWILNVLSDLQAFAEANKLEALAEQLMTTKFLAAVELSQRSFYGLGAVAATCSPPTEVN